MNSDNENKSDVSIKVKNFGPISNGIIKLSPLTIFTGPNNAGKSYLATLIYSINKSFNDLRKSIITSSKKEEIKHLISDYKNHELLLKKLLEKPNYKKLGIDFIDCLKLKMYDNLLVGLENAIVNSFASPIKDLVKIGNRYFTIDINFNGSSLNLKSSSKGMRFYKDPELCPETLHIKSYIGEDAITDFNMRQILLEFLPDKDKKLEREELISKLFNIPATELKDFTYHGPYGCISTNSKKDVYLLININQLKAMSDNPIETLNRMIFSVIYDFMKFRIFKSFENRCYYLPAAKYGILQAHKAIAASIVRKAPSAGLKGFEIPKLSGVISEFISTIIELPDIAFRYSDYLNGAIDFDEDAIKIKKVSKELVADFEKEIISGEIQLHPSDDMFKYPEIRYHHLETEIPLHRASSTVSELAPLFLYLKELIRLSDILIIEEPEAHLHPANQRILGKYLVRLIREGLNIFITTHSEWLIEQLNNFLKLGKLSEGNRIKIDNYTKNDYLKQEDVSIYIFNFDNKSNGYNINKIDIEKDGISEESFLKIDETLYKETYRIQKILNEQK